MEFGITTRQWNLSRCVTQRLKVRALYNWNNAPTKYHIDTKEAAKETTYSKQITKYATMGKQSTMTKSGKMKDSIWLLDGFVDVLGICGKPMPALQHIQQQTWWHAYAMCPLQNGILLLTGMLWSYSCGASEVLCCSKMVTTEHPKTETWGRHQATKPQTHMIWWQIKLTLQHKKQDNM